jgi:hypothetical protein
VADVATRLRLQGVDVVARLRDMLGNGTIYAQEVAVAVPSGTTLAVTDSRTAANPLPISQSGRTILATAAQSIIANGNTADLDVSLVEELAIDFAITTALDAAATVQFFIDRKLSTGQYAPIASTAAGLGAAGITSLSLGAGMSSNVAAGNTCRVRWVVTGAPTVGTAALSITGK